MVKKVYLQKRKDVLLPAGCVLFAHRGFALIEAFIAIAILLSAVTGVMTVSAKGLELTGIARNKITAFYLAQEPIELIHNIRDENRLASRPRADWLFGLSLCNPGPCTIDATDRSIAPCGVSACVPLRQEDGTGGRYGYDEDWNPTMFIRTVSIDEFAASREAKVTVRITWQERAGTKTLILENSILAWAFP